MTRRQVAQDVYQRTYGEPLPGIRITDPVMASRLRSPAWKIAGACAGFGGSAWFMPERSLTTRWALGVCQTCPVRRICLASALTYGEEYGVWGGLLASEREPLMVAAQRGIPVNVLVAEVLGEGECRDVAS